MTLQEIDAEINKLEQDRDLVNTTLDELKLKADSLSNSITSAKQNTASILDSAIQANEDALKNINALIGNSERKLSDLNNQITEFHIEKLEQDRVLVNATLDELRLKAGSLSSSEVSAQQNTSSILDSVIQANKDTLENINALIGNSESKLSDLDNKIAELNIKLVSETPILYGDSKEELSETRVKNNANTVLESNNPSFAEDAHSGGLLRALKKIEPVFKLFEAVEQVVQIIHPSQRELMEHVINEANKDQPKVKMEIPDAEKYQPPLVEKINLSSDEILALENTGMVVSSSSGALLEASPSNDKNHNRSNDIAEEEVNNILAKGYSIEKDKEIETAIHSWDEMMREAKNKTEEINLSQKNDWLSR
ncbi:hypothetical protein RO575_13355 [Methylomonas sp. MO1]|uniref:hypothetical protein n=1 Tax=unclassified Methylomonas TaxID=2608980 RepID=UPI00047BA5A7|nr:MULTISPECIES: hypothetical protein [unclassified Methylomonas]MDT4290547.1 hypothetical protein [Methylomonas sp. MO1]